jgi:protein-S-isoprenylcysteine O-methyltransferase Ste14
MVFMSIGFIALIVIPGLDHRFGWSQAPAIVAFAGNALVAAGFFAVFLVFRQNTFASSTIGVVEGQTLVSTGPYAIVRHPMYAGALIYLGVWSRPLMGHPCQVIRGMRYGTDFAWVRHDDRGGPSSDTA